MGAKLPFIGEDIIYGLKIIGHVCSIGGSFNCGLIVVKSIIEYEIVPKVHPVVQAFHMRNVNTGVHVAYEVEVPVLVARSSQYFQRSRSGRVLIKGQHLARCGIKWQGEWLQVHNIAEGWRNATEIVNR